MKLKEHIDLQGLTIAETARQLNKRQQTVHLWVNQQRIPRHDEIIDIYRWSKGVVQPNDFYDLPDLEEEARANGPISQQIHEAAA